MKKRGSGKRPAAIIAYAVFVGILISSYFAPLQQIVSGRGEISNLQSDISALRQDNTEQRREIEALHTDSGIERVARERYGMIKPGEEAYIVPQNLRDGQQ